MRKIKRHLRCPSCQGLNTKRHGIRVLKQQKTNRHRVSQHRWYCTDCGHVFIPIIGAKETISSSAHRVTELYFEAGASYRAVAKDIGTEPKTAYNKIIPLGFNSKAPYETSVELNPKWSGYLLVDSDSLRVGTTRKALMLGVDAYSQDIPHAILSDEDAQNWTHFFLVMKDPLHYSLKGIISDDDPSIEEARKDIFPNIPFQLCVRHFEQALERFTRYHFIQRKGYWRETNRFLSVVHKMLYAKNYLLASKYMNAMLCDPGFKQAGLYELVAKVREKFPVLTTHHFHYGMPRTTNIIEGVISRLDSKINQADGYKYYDTAWATLKMLIMRYRF